MPLLALETHGRLAVDFQFRPGSVASISEAQGELLALLLGLFLFTGESDLEIVRIGEVDVATGRELGREEVR